MGYVNMRVVVLCTSTVGMAAPRHQWYQIQDRVVVDVYAKGLQPDQVRADFEERRLQLVSLPLR